MASRRKRVTHREKELIEFSEKFPNLAREMKRRKAVHIGSVRTDVREAEKLGSHTQGYEPTVIDFIRRCDRDEQALEIIDFLESRGEIEPAYARRLRTQLTKLGLRSFGPKKERGCYESFEER